MRIVICEDEAVQSAALMDCIDRWHGLHSETSVSIDVFRSAEDMLEALPRGLHCDLIFLDIVMPDGLDGFALAEAIRKQNDQISLVFVTNSQSYALQGYAVSALRYITKPFADWQIFEVLDIVSRQLLLQQGRQLVLSTKDRQIVLPYREILYVESQAHRLVFHRASDGSCLSVRMRVTDALKALDGDLFIRTHRGSIINVMYIRTLQRCQLTLVDGTVIPIGHSYTESAHSAFTKYYIGRDV